MHRFIVPFCLLLSACVPAAEPDRSVHGIRRRSLPDLVGRRYAGALERDA